MAVKKVAKKKVAKKKVAKKKVSKKAPARRAPVVTAIRIKRTGIVVLSDGGRTSTAKGSMGFEAKVGDVFKKNKDGSYSKA